MEVMPTYNEDGRDAIVKFNKIKIKAKDWEQVKEKDLKVEILASNT
jgi:hypothetical protein